jgi:polyferredoxin
MRAQTLRKLRPWIQLAALVLFIALLIGAGRIAWLPADLFFRLDPLAGITGMIAARQIVPALLIGAAAMLVVTLLLGRVWCGWICPLGTVLDVTPAQRNKRYESDPTPRLRSVKYVLLTLILGAALLGNLTFLILDPITLLYRTAATALWPALVALISGAETVLYRLPFLQGAIDRFEGAFRGVILPPEQPAYGMGVLLLLIFAGILALNAIRDRFWCRYLCPLGALLGLVSKAAWLRREVGDVCTECQRCARACPVGTIDPARHFASDPAECTVCLDCIPVCAKAGQGFTRHVRPAPHQAYDPSRRQFLATAGSAVVAVGLFAAGPDFLSKCIRCGICVKVCPTSGLQPSFVQVGWSGLWTPVLVPRLGYCDYSCNACGGACPTAAIPALILEEKRLAVIGHAYIDRDRCLPWADDRNCLVCEEMCPVPEKAIILEDVTVTTVTGEAVDIRRPGVVRDRCIGCGICENRCPLNGEAAIRVYAPSELG